MSPHFPSSLPPGAIPFEAMTELQQAELQARAHGEGLGETAMDAVDLGSDVLDVVSEAPLEGLMEAGSGAVESVVEAGGSLLEGVGDILGSLFD